jgi:predicted nuclease of predicted toxin-antitoxin system
VKWLLDANLSYRLVRLLAHLPVEVLHVSRSGLLPAAEDEEIWSWAREHNAVIITNDEDFYRLAGMFGFPPNIVLLRTGNQSTRFIASLLEHHMEDINALYTSDELGVLELY